MRRSVIALPIVMTIAGLACNENSPPSQPAERQSLSPRQDNGSMSTSSGRSPARTASAAPTPPPNIPKDARWTIFCASISGPDHARQGRGLRDQLIQTTGMRDWYTVEADQQTTLYYGFYRTIHDDKDSRESGRAHADREKISKLTSRANGDKLFGNVYIVGLESADPDAPPEWNLVNAKGDYSVQIGVYKDSPALKHDGPDRKQAAVQAVREARVAGYEAYYYHGPSASSVCIGAWPASAVIEHNQFRSKVPGSVPQVTLGALPPPTETTAPNGQPIEIMQASIEIQDPTLLATMKAFPKHAINGEEGQLMRDSKTGQVRMATRPSFLVHIPHSDLAARPISPASIHNLHAEIEAGPAPGNSPRQPRPMATRQQGGQGQAATGGKLRSIEE